MPKQDLLKLICSYTLILFLLVNNCQSFSRIKSSNYASIASSIREERKILLHSIVLDANQLANREKMRRDLSSNLIVSESELELEDRLMLVHIRNANNGSKRKAVEEALGCKLRRYIPHNTFIVRLSPRQVLV